LFIQICAAYIYYFWEYLNPNSSVSCILSISSQVFALLILFFRCRVFFRSCSVYMLYVTYCISFCLSDDDFEIKLKIYSLIHLSCFNSYLEFHDDLIFRNLFLFLIAQSTGNVLNQGSIFEFFTSIQVDTRVLKSSIPIWNLVSQIWVVGISISGIQTR
jgi:hypothetical protein